MGAWIIDPNTNAPISSGYNGPPRGLDIGLCGGNHCERDIKKIKSGTSTEVGCHHAEANAFANALRIGASTLGAHLVVSTPPCLSCAKQAHHGGIAAVHTVDLIKEAYPEGTSYLEKVGIPVHRYVVE